jgi:hypothetical protein
VTVTIEIHADIPEGAEERAIRTVSENCKVLKFKDPSRGSLKNDRAV